MTESNDRLWKMIENGKISYDEYGLPTEKEQLHFIENCLNDNSPITVRELLACI